MLFHSYVCLYLPIISSSIIFFGVYLSYYFVVLDFCRICEILLSRVQVPLFLNFVGYIYRETRLFGQLLFLKINLALSLVTNLDLRLDRLFTSFDPDSI